MGINYCNIHDSGIANQALLRLRWDPPRKVNKTKTSSIGFKNSIIANRKIVFFLKSIKTYNHSNVNWAHSKVISFNDSYLTSCREGQKKLCVDIFLISRNFMIDNVIGNFTVTLQLRSINYWQLLFFSKSNWWFRYMKTMAFMFAIAISST